jgi:hypothetical protein
VDVPPPFEPPPIDAPPPAPFPPLDEELLSPESEHALSTGAKLREVTEARVASDFDNFFMMYQNEVKACSPMARRISP